MCKNRRLLDVRPEWKLNFTQGRHITMRQTLRERSIYSFTPLAIQPAHLSFTPLLELSLSVAAKVRLFLIGVERISALKEAVFG